MDKHKANTKEHDKLLITLQHLTEEIDLDGKEKLESDQIPVQDKSTINSQDDKPT